MTNKKVPARQKSIYKYVPGDWICPTCEDLQFRRNQSCRICGTMNPMVLAQELALAAGMSYKQTPAGTYPPVGQIPQGAGGADAAAAPGASYYDASATNTTAASSQPTSRFSSKEASGVQDDASKKGKGKGKSAGTPVQGAPGAGYPFPNNELYGGVGYITDPSYAQAAAAAAAANAAAVGSGGYGVSAPLGNPAYQAQAALGAINTAYLMQQNALLMAQPPATYPLAGLVGANLSGYYPGTYPTDDAFAQAVAQQNALKQAAAYAERGEEAGAW